jgi:hypothetical protein
MKKTTPTQYSLLAKIINEEIDMFLDLINEQGMPPAGPPATPPASPEGSGEAGNKEDEKEPTNEGEELAKSLSGKTERDIRKTILSYSQKGDKRELVSAFLEFFEENKNDPDKVPPNLKKVVDQLENEGFKLPHPKEPETEEQSQPAQVSEGSELQKSLREYLHYRKLYIRSGGK